MTARASVTGVEHVDELADRLARVAAQLAARIRDDHPEDVAAWLLEQVPDPADRFRLHFVQAAAIPVDQPWHQLTRWARGLSSHPPVIVEDQAAGVDEALAARVRAGQPIVAPPRVKRALVAQLTSQGLSARAIAPRLCLTPRQVERYRQDLRSGVAA